MVSTESLDFGAHDDIEVVIDESTLRVLRNGTGSYTTSDIAGKPVSQGVLFPSICFHPDAPTGASVVIEGTPMEARPVTELLVDMCGTEKVFREESSQRFYFLNASVVRKCSMARLPRLQDIRSEYPGWIVERFVDMTTAVLGNYRETMLAVSHRWETPDEPDPGGTQLATLKRHLDDHPEIEYVWCDFPCMPQMPRSQEEEEEFKDMLHNINVIYIGMQVLVMLDMMYMSRFWTQAEAWMSMQDGCTSGLATSWETNRRYDKASA